MSLIDELAADQDPRAACRLCAWIAGRPEEEQREWDQALADRRFTHASVIRALVRRKAGVGKGSVEGHRRAGHRRPL